MANSNYRQIGDAIGAEVAALPEAGRLHLYQRWAADIGRYIDLFRWRAQDGKDQIRGWVLTRESAREELGSFASSAPGGFVPAGVNRRTHTFLLFGVMSLEDDAASEIEFQDLIESICGRFRAGDALRLRGNISSLERLTPPQVDRIDLRAFGSTLCHTAEVRIQAIERIVRA